MFPISRLDLRERERADGGSAQAAASPRFFTPSFASTLLTWCPTVLVLRCSRAAISALLRPSATRWSTSCSRRVRSPASFGPVRPRTPWRRNSSAAASASRGAPTPLELGEGGARLVDRDLRLLRLESAGELEPGPRRLDRHPRLSEPRERGLEGSDGVGARRARPRHALARDPPSRSTRSIPDAPAIRAEPIRRPLRAIQVALGQLDLDEHREERRRQDVVVADPIQASMDRRGGERVLRLGPGADARSRARPPGAPRTP